MLLPALFAAVLVSTSIQAAPQSPPPAAPATAPEAAPRQVCRLETVTGTNRRTRVCRTPTPPGTQDQSTREMMRDMQRARMPDQG